MNVYLPLSAQLTRLFEDPRVMSKNNPLCSLSKSRKRAYRNLATLIVEIHKDAVQKSKAPSLISHDYFTFEYKLLR